MSLHYYYDFFFLKINFQRVIVNVIKCKNSGNKHAQYPILTLMNKIISNFSR